MLSKAEDQNCCMALNNAVAGYWILFGSKEIGHLGVDFMLGVQQAPVQLARH